VIPTPTLPRSADEGQLLASNPIPVEAEAAVVVPIGARERLLLLARKSGNLADAMSAEMLATLGNKVVTDYEKDDGDRKDWKDTVEEMLKLAAQSGRTAKRTIRGKARPTSTCRCSPSQRFSSTPACIPLRSRATRLYCARSSGRTTAFPLRAPNPRIGHIAARPANRPDGNPVPDEEGQIQPQWQVPPGAKARGQGVSANI
jgi:hypothetical protein